jgi:hypothetical protein
MWMTEDVLVPIRLEHSSYIAVTRVTQLRCNQWFITLWRSSVASIVRSTHYQQIKRVKLRKRSSGDFLTVDFSALLVILHSPPDSESDPELSLPLESEDDELELRFPP